MEQKTTIYPIAPDLTRLEAIELWLMLIAKNDPKAEEVINEINRRNLRGEWPRLERR